MLLDCRTKATLSESCIKIIIKLGGYRPALVGDHIILCAPNLVIEKMTRIGKLAEAMLVVKGDLIGVLANDSHNSLAVNGIAYIIEKKK